MFEITAVEFNQARLDTTNKGIDFITTYQSKCGRYFSRAHQVDTVFEYVESRYNKRTKQYKYYGSR
jgi:hypothetical protein